MFFDESYIGQMNDLYSEGTFAYIMDSKSSIDIDTQDDFNLAKFFII